MVGEHNENLLSNMLPVYYTRLFPQNIFCRWLSCGSSPQPLSNRELSFTLADDVYLRYLSISNQKELHTLLLKKCPYKLDIGAVYNTKPSIARHDSIVLARELVFDIDLTDYDEVRTCCQEAKVCEKCWKFMVVACEIVDKALKEVIYPYTCKLRVRLNTHPNPLTKALVDGGNIRILKQQHVFNDQERLKPWLKHQKSLKHFNYSLVTVVDK